MTPFTYQRATSLDHAVAALAAAGPGGKIMAGGQSLLLALKERQMRPTGIVAIGALPEMRGTALAADGGLVVGPSTTYAALARADFSGWHAMLAKVAGNLADRSVRSLGTIGGGVCQADPRYDMPVFCSAAGATFKLASARGDRTLDADGFFDRDGGTHVAADEILVAITLPPLARWDAVAFEKFRFRTFEAAVGLVGGAVKLDGAGRIEAIRIAVGAVAKAPSIPAAAMSRLIGRSFAEIDIDVVAEAISREVLPLEAGLGRLKKYQAELTISLARRVLKQLGQGAGP